MRRLRSDSGAVAVEFALVLVPLLLILMGIIDFGHVYSEKLTITAAAREGARAAAVVNEASATSAINKAMAGLSPAPTIHTVQFRYEPDPNLPPCRPGATVTVTVTYPGSSMTGMFGGGEIIGTGVMRCGG